MSGNLLTAIKKDAKMFVTSGGFEEDITLSNPSGDLTVNITGFATKHHINFNSDGLPINSKNAHICIDEQQNVVYSELVCETANEPNYDAALAVFTQQ